METCKAQRLATSSVEVSSYLSANYSYYLDSEDKRDPQEGEFQWAVLLSSEAKAYTRN